MNEWNEEDEKKLLAIVKRAAFNSCCICCDSCLACDALELLRELGEHDDYNGN